MTTKDLHIIYKKDMGFYPPTHPFGTIANGGHYKYEEWLENKLITIINGIGLENTNPEEVIQIIENWNNGK